MSVRVHVKIYERHPVTKVFGQKPVYSSEWAADAVPRVGELLTIHEHETNFEHSITAEVTGVQHVWRLGAVSSVCITAAKS